MSWKALAVDLGATSGRAIVGEVADDRLTLTEVHRFTNQMTEVAGHLRWQVHDLLREIGNALRRAREAGHNVASIGIDNWGVATRSQKNKCGGSLASGASCVISVVFAPTAKDLRKGTIAIADNASGSPQQAPLTGVGTIVSLSPGSLNFGHQRMKTTSAPQAVTLTNIGNATLHLTGLSSSNPDFAATSNCGASVAPKSRCMISVTFTPHHVGGSAGTINVFDDAGPIPQRVVVIGTGTP
jgi:hypothetical protein